MMERNRISNAEFVDDFVSLVKSRPGDAIFAGVIGSHQNGAINLNYGTFNLNWSQALVVAASLVDCVLACLIEEANSSPDTFQPDALQKVTQLQADFRKCGIHNSREPGGLQ